MSRVLDFAMRHPWAITREWLDLIVAVATRENGDVEAIERELGRPLANTREVTVRDGIAIVPVTGPLFRYANVFTRLSRATSFEELATDIGEALRSPEVNGILLHIDSPGGQVNGTEETAELIYRARQEKPIHAHVSGQGQSGGYWIASAASSISVGATGIMGSIGAVLTVVDTSSADAKNGVRTLEIVSSQSPKKRLDPFSDEGRSELQTLIDDMAQVFIDTVARNRGVSPEVVLEDFGQGGSFVGQAAVEAGLADRVSTLEDAIAEMSRAHRSGRSFVAGAAAKGGPVTREGTMPGKTQAPAADGAPAMTWENAKEHFAAEIDAEVQARVAAKVEEERKAARAEGANAERARILAIQDLAIEGAEAVIAECVKDAECTVEKAALRLVEWQKKARASEGDKRKDALRKLEAAEAELDAPSPAVETPAAGSDEAVAARILSIHRPQRAAQ